MRLINTVWFHRVILSKGWIILVGIAFLLGITVGYYLYPQAPVGTFSSSIIQYAPIVGTVILILKTIRDYFKENVLDYDGIYKKPEKRNGRNEMGVYLRIVKKRGQGRAENCEGYMTIQNPDGTRLETSTIWEGIKSSKCRHISIQSDLKLFNVSEDGNKIIVFRNFEDSPSPAPDETYEGEEELNSILSVKLGVSSGTVPKKPFSMKISDVINIAKK